MLEDFAAQSELLWIRILLSGKVQGFGYRFATRQKAEQLGINGWVQNLSDSRVEIIVGGDRSCVDQMVQWSHLGPSDAIVQAIDVEEISPQTTNNFAIKF
jgi:acylphosphatase